MITRESVVYRQVRDMAPTEKLQLVDLLLADLDQPDEDIDRIWAAEAKKRWAAYKAGQLKTVPYTKAEKFKDTPQKHESTKFHEGNVKIESDTGASQKYHKAF